MVETQQIDIFKAPVDIIVHQVSCFHVMGGGIALEIRTQFPEAYEADLKTLKADRNKLGTFSVAKIKNRTGQLKYIINLYSQFDFGRSKRHTNYEALCVGLEALKKRLIDNKRNNFVIGIPYKMGCVLGGGDWQIVEAMIKSVFEEGPMKVIICRID